MRAIIYERFGEPDVLQLADVPEPDRRPGHARVRVMAAALNPKDVLVRKGKMQWLTGRGMPRTPGYDFAGILVDDAGGLPAGTEVFGMVGSHDAGACAEILSVPFDELDAKPASLTMVEAAALPLAALTALQGLRDELDVQPGDRVLLNGASGGVGTLAVQIAVAMGAHVIAVCSARNAGLVTELGAHQVLDYQTDDVQALRDLDAVFDIFGSLPWNDAKPLLTRTGNFCTTIPRKRAVARGILRRASLHRAALVVVKSNRRDLGVLRRWVDEGQLRPVVDRVWRLEDSAEAHAYVQTKRARGKVVLEL